nr:MAG TPA: hypothetical protein [Caudoviricetes sp.]
MNLKKGDLKHGLLFLLNLKGEKMSIEVHKQMTKPVLVIQLRD